MKARIPKHREFIINLDEKEEPRYQECWDKLNQIVKDYQKQGIASALCDALERSVVSPRILVHASITARPFFEKRGYRLIKEQTVERHGVKMTNFALELER